MRRFFISPRPLADCCGTVHADIPSPSYLRRFPTARRHLIYAYLPIVEKKGKKLREIARFADLTAGGGAISFLPTIIDIIWRYGSRFGMRRRTADGGRAHGLPGGRWKRQLAYMINYGPRGLGRAGGARYTKIPSPHPPPPSGRCGDDDVRFL